jgi:tetratricopeptide (TPR) repeat protein
MAMKASALIGCLLFACLTVSPRLSAQTPQARNVVSVHELSIPPKALRAFEQGSELLAKKDPARSLPHLQRAISDFPGYYEAYYNMGLAYLKLWRIPEAEQAYRKSIELSGGRYAQPFLALGAILDDGEKFVEAESVTRKGLDLDPDAWRGHYYLGVALLGLNRLEEAEKNVREAIRSKLDFVQAYLVLAEIHNREKNYHALLNDLDEYLNLEPNGPAGTGIKALRESAQRMLAESRNTTAFAQPQP